MKAVVVGISDCQVSAEPESELVTYALGSCIAVSVWDPLRRIAGLLHYMLPESNMDARKAEASPCMFADTGIECLFKMAADKGADRRRMVVRLAGGAQVLDPQGVFNIGKRNYQAARKMLWKYGVLIASEAVGGEVSRTVRLTTENGKLRVREGNGTEMELPLHAQSRKETANGVPSFAGR
jgi:chemotaxis protein CheD